jgi:acyl-coenzyme A synthetase/AMP-(fatty) acid ligase
MIGLQGYFTAAQGLQLATLRATTSGGEVLNPATVALARKVAPGLKIFNAYGEQLQFTSYKM